MNGRHPPRIRPVSAFTLLEVMLSVVVAAFILVAINGVFFGALRLRTRATEAMEKSRPFERALAILRKDLSNLVPPGGALAGDFQTSPTSSSEMGSFGTTLQLGQASPEFCTATAIIDDFTPWSEVQRVAYLLLEPTNRTARGQDLVRSVSRNLLATTYEPPVHDWLLHGVESISFLFYDGTQWRDYWDSKSEETPLPRAVKVELQLAAADLHSKLPPPVEIVVPLFLDGSTNQTTSTTTSTNSP